MTIESQPTSNGYVFLIGYQTDVGRARKHNEDFVGYHLPPDPEKRATYGALMVVCDGVGGAAAGEIASETAVRLIIDAYYHAPAKMTVQDRLAEAIQRANETIYELNQQRDREMATTVVAAVVLDKHLVVAHAGDSRAYLIRGGNMVQLTQDHSWVEEMVRSGDLTPEQARKHPWRNRITRGLGMNPSVKVDVNIYDWRPGDTLVLCSDGLTRHVNDDEIAAVAINYSPKDAVKHLIDMANQRGGKDNISVIVARSTPVSLAAGALPPEEEQEPTFVPPPAKPLSISAADLRRNKLILLVGALIVLLMCLGGSGVALVSLFRQAPTPTIVSSTMPRTAIVLSPIATTTTPTHSPTPTATATATSTLTPTPTSTPTPPLASIPTITPSSIPSATAVSTSPAPVASPIFTPTETSPSGVPSPSTSPTATPGSSASNPSRAIVVPQLGARLREEGDENAKELDVLRAGTVIKVLEGCEFTEEDWCRVKAMTDDGEKEGYIRGDLLFRLQMEISDPGEDGAFASLPVPPSLMVWDVRFLSQDQLLLATTHSQHKTPLLFRLSLSMLQQKGLHSLDENQLTVLGYSNLHANGFEIEQGVLAPNGSKFGLLQKKGYSIYVWDLPKDDAGGQKPSQAMEKCRASQPILSIAFGPKGGRVACGGGFGVFLEKVSDNQQWAVEETPPPAVADLAVALRAKAREVRGTFNVVAVVRQGELPYAIYKEQGKSLNQISNGSEPSGDFTSIAMDKHADWLALGKKTGEVLVAKWDDQNEGFQGATTIPKMSLSGEITLLTFSEDSSQLAIASGSQVVVWKKVNQGEGVDWEKQQLWEREESIKALAFSPNNAYLAVLTPRRLLIYRLAPGS